MLTFVCMKWARSNQGYILPGDVQYTAQHVNVLRNMLERHCHIPHRLVCVTDDGTDIDPRIEVIPLWDYYRSLGGCYNRLWLFSEDARTLFGDRLCSIDLDCVIVNDITPLVDRPEEFVMAGYSQVPNHAKIGKIVDQYYNGSLYLMSTGSRRQVWDRFDPDTSPQFVKSHPTLVGSDQAWIQLVLGTGEARWTKADGLYQYRDVTGPLDLEQHRIIFFSGRYDPSTHPKRWVRDHWY